MTVAEFTGTTSLGSAAAALVEKLAEQRAQPITHPDGVFFGMPEEEYHADAALGSSAMKALAENPCEYWFDSPYNPRRELEETASQKYGTALHKCILEGRAAFEARYAPCDYPGNIKAGIEERKVITAQGKIALSREDYDRILIAGATVRANPHLADAFTNGMPEVSVFWTDDRGIHKKARIDFLKVRASVDVKTIANQNKLEFKRACRGAIASYRYDVQAAHYSDGREMLRMFAQEGRIFGDHDPEWLAKVVASEAWASVFIFVQSQRSPLVHGIPISPGNGILELARQTIRKAEENYISFSERFGVETPWVLVEPMEELLLEDMPNWFARD